jgi:replicative DNA helicase
MNERTERRRKPRQEQSEAWKLIYEGLVRENVPSDPKAEMALLAVCWMTEDAGLISELHENDFYDLKNKFIYSEFKLLIESGEPFGDSVAVIRWFGTEPVQKRAFEAIGERNAKELLMILLQEFEANYFGTAHKDYYRSVIRRDRLRRAIFTMTLKALEMNINNNKEPWKTVEVIGGMNEQLFQMCYREFPGEMEQ